MVSGGYLHASGLTATPGGDWIVGGFSDTTSGPIALRFLGPGSTAPSSSEVTCRREASLQPAAAVDFGSWAVGTVSPPRSFTFTSTGSGPVRVEAVGLANNNAGQFRVVSDECSGRTVPAKASCTVSVSLTPTRVDGMGSRLIVWHNGRAGSNGTYLMGRGSSTVSPPTTVPPTTTTSTVPPPTARTAAGIDPITAATGVAVDRNIVVTFTEPVERSSAQAAFSLRRAGTTVNLGGAFTWDAASTVMTFNPFANLLANTAYTVAVAAPARDTAGTPMAAAFESSFTSDAQAPTVTGTDPPEGRTGVSVGGDLVVTFSEPVERNSAQTSFSLCRTGTTVNLGGAFTWNCRRP